MTQQPIKMENLNWYLNHVEERLSALEKENKKLKSLLAENQSIETNRNIRNVQEVLPQTNLLSPNFLKRAFAVWGHFFVANFLIGISVAAIYLCLTLLILGPAAKSILQNLR